MASQAAGESEEDFPLWRFSLDYYGRPGVAPVLLEMQDQLGADVNMVLFGLWRAYERRALTPAEFTVMDAEIADWRNSMVLPVRKLRRALKTLNHGEGQGLYKEAKALELKLERLQQHRMQRAADLSPGAPALDTRGAAMSNLAAYSHFLALPLPNETAQFLSGIVGEMVE